MAMNAIEFGGTPASLPAEHVPEQSRDSRMQVLVVDDDRVHRTALGGLLKRREYDVHVADTVAQAWAILETRPISMVFTDWMMPEVSGVELVRRVRQHEFGRYVYIIL